MSPPITRCTIHVLDFTINAYRPIPFQSTDKAETICHKLCRDLKLTPATTLLFGLRHATTDEFLPAGRSPVANEKYEFRLRFQMSDHTALERIDRNAYDYLYQQVKCDLIANRIRGLEYPFSKEKVAGVCVTNMLVDMLEKNMTSDEVIADFGKYFPAKLMKKHPVYLKRIVITQLNQLSVGLFDPYKVRGTVLSSIKELVQTYMVEQCSCFDDSEQKTVVLTFDPHHQKTPGLIAAYSDKQEHVCRLEDIFTIVVEKDAVRFEIRNKPTGFTVRISSPTALESFVSGICGYYRLMVKWTVNLCLLPNLHSPHLDWLSRWKFHGPICGEFAYNKLKDNQYLPGSYILRECEREFDIFYIDIVLTEKTPQTFTITRQQNMWHWHTAAREEVKFKVLADLVKGIPSPYKKRILLSPSEFDNSTFLLLCRPPSAWMVKRSLTEVGEAEMRLNKSQILNPNTDIRKYMQTMVKTNNGIIGQMKADWILPENKKLEVTLKILQVEQLQKDFLVMADIWSNLFAPELIKMYGFTMSWPPMFIIESIRMGPLDEFLRKARVPVSTVCLIEASYSLARALHYLQENQMVHGHIRCSNLYVVKYQTPNLLVVRLGDPGFQHGFSKFDVPWIPIEYTDGRTPRLDFKAEIWAFATTLWEIFSHGRTPTGSDFINTKRFLPQPLGCPDDIYKIMKEGWNPVPQKRFTPQMIFSRLIAARDAKSGENAHHHVNGSRVSVNSGESRVTEQSDLETINKDTISTHSDGSNSSNHSDDDLSDIGRSQTEALVDISKPNPNPTPNVEKEFSMSILEMSNGSRIVLQGQVGRGHFGIVYRGQMEDLDNKVRKVAVKRLKMNNEDVCATISEDFQREINIMQKLQHPNIVQIITCIVDPMSIVMEYVEHGSLLVYLKSKAPGLNNRRLFAFAKDIAEGMKYLGQQKIVHRDLAARNVLVTVDDSVKISDFGLAQVVNTDGYYMTQTLRDVPVIGYAPEAIELKYSFKSDVWSYGVTLFEIFSRGGRPDLVPGVLLDQQTLLRKLRNGDRLARPPDCPVNVYNTIMMKCWKLETKDRPSFDDIIKLVDNCIAECDQVIG